MRNAVLEGIFNNTVWASLGQVQSDEITWTSTIRACRWSDVEVGGLLYVALYRWCDVSRLENTAIRIVGRTGFVQSHSQHRRYSYEDNNHHKRQNWYSQLATAQASLDWDSRLRRGLQRVAVVHGSVGRHVCLDSWWYGFVVRGVWTYGLKDCHGRLQDQMP